MGIRSAWNSGSGFLPIFLNHVYNAMRYDFDASHSSILALSQRFFPNPSFNGCGKSLLRKRICKVVLQHLKSSHSSFVVTNLLIIKPL